MEFGTRPKAAGAGAVAEIPYHRVVFFRMPGCPWAPWLLAEGLKGLEYK